MPRMQYNIGSILWTKTKDLNDMRRSGRGRARNEKVDQRIPKLVDSNRIDTTGDRQNILK